VKACEPDDSAVYGPWQSEEVLTSFVKFLPQSGATPLGARVVPASGPSKQRRLTLVLCRSFLQVNVSAPSVAVVSRNRLRGADTRLISR
jgi:hypothetical protein